MKPTLIKIEGNKCTFCSKKGKYSFGWLDSENNWRDKHLTCHEHAPISVYQQNFRMNMEMLREKSKLFRKSPAYFNLTTNP